MKSTGTSTNRSGFRGGIHRPALIVQRCKSGGFHPKLRCRRGAGCSGQTQGPLLRGARQGREGSACPRLGRQCTAAQRRVQREVTWQLSFGNTFITCMLRSPRWFSRPSVRFPGRAADTVCPLSRAGLPERAGTTRGGGRAPRAGTRRRPRRGTGATAAARTGPRARRGPGGAPRPLTA